MVSSRLICFLLSSANEIDENTIEWFLLIYLSIRFRYQFVFCFVILIDSVDVRWNHWFAFHSCPYTFELFLLVLGSSSSIVSSPKCILTRSMPSEKKIYSYINLFWFFFCRWWQILILHFCLQISILTLQIFNLLLILTLILLVNRNLLFVVRNSILQLLFSKFSIFANTSI